MVKETIELSEQKIIEKILLGDINLYEILIRKYNPRLYRICRSYIKDDDEIEDVMQTAYIKAYQNLKNFEGRSSFSTWLIRILISEALQKLKYQNRFEEINESEISQTPSGMNPERTLLNAELKTALEIAIDKLPEKYKTVFMMREVEEMSIIETSDSLGISESNVKVRLNRAKEMLREVLNQYYRTVDVFSFDLVRCDRIVKNVLQRINY